MAGDRRRQWLNATRLRDKPIEYSIESVLDRAASELSNAIFAVWLAPIEQAEQRAVALNQL